MQIGIGRIETVEILAQGDCPSGPVLYKLHKNKKTVVLLSKIK